MRSVQVLLLVKGALTKMKNKIRQECKQKRAEMKQQEVLKKSLSATKLFLESDIYRNSKNIMLYMPLRNEISTLEIIKSAHKDNKTVLVPITDRESFQITAHKINEDTEFTKGVFSLTEPKGQDVYDVRKIDTIIVPGVAFDIRGARVGFGKGCYDKFLENASATLVGYCYDFQLYDKIETEEFDIRMDYILTEKEIIVCNQ